MSVTLVTVASLCFVLDNSDLGANPTALESTYDQDLAASDAILPSSATLLDQAHREEKKVRMLSKKASSTLTEIRTQMKSEENVFKDLDTSIHKW